MLEFDPKQRYSAEQCYNHPWIQNNHHEKPLNSRVLAKLERFHISNKLKVVIWEFISIYVYSSKEKQNLVKEFKQLDKNGDGLLTKEELVEAYQKYYKDHFKAEEIVNNIFNQIDIDNSGKVDINEFSVVYLQSEKLKQQ